MPVDDGPPEWFDQAPPLSAPGNAAAKAGQPQRQNGNGKPRQAPSATVEEVGDFYAWLDNPRTALELRKIIPSYLDVDLFLATCKDAALSNPRLLAPPLRPSLLRAVARAARQGLRPDGREGALVPRYSMEERAYTVSFQAMVWGLTKLGRLTGAIKTIRPIIVFEGETFEMEEGDEPRWIHKVDRKIVDQAYQSLYGGMTAGDHPRLVVNAEDFFKQVSCAYCIITGADGTVTKRWMSARRIDLIRKQQGKNTPWYGPFVDEMIIKTVILYTAKHLDLDVGNPATKAFREALLDDIGTDDFDRLAPPEPTRQTAIGHETKLHAFETQFMKPKETADLAPIAEISPWKLQLDAAMASAKTVSDMERLTSEGWFQGGIAALREAGQDDFADELISGVVRRSEELQAKGTPVD